MVSRGVWVSGARRGEEGPIPSIYVKVYIVEGPTAGLRIQLKCSLRDRVDTGKCDTDSEQFYQSVTS